MPMNTIKTAKLLALLMVAAAAAGAWLRPDSPQVRSKPAYALGDAIPDRFGDWQMLPDAGNQVINPQAQQVLDRIYSQVLTRTYRYADGYRIMLSLAYGDDQRGDLQAHMPEVCYPAQGFELNSQERGNLATDFGMIPVSRLRTSLGTRQEPVTYWFQLGNTTMKTGERWEKRLVEFRFALTGQAPSGLLFRVSSIDADATGAFAMQDRFVRDLLGAVSTATRTRLSGFAP